MAQFDTFFTGKGLSTPLPPKDTRAEDRLSDFITQAERLKLDIYRENSREFQKNISITPEFVLSKSARDNTARQIELFNQKWAKVKMEADKTGGMTDKQKSDMTTDKMWILQQNQNDKAQQELAQQMKDIVYRNPDKYDRDEFDLEYARLINEGKFGLTTPPPKAISLDEWYNKDANKFKGTEMVSFIPVSNDPTQRIAKSVWGTPEQGKMKVEQDILGNEQLRKWVVNKFQSLKVTDPDTYRKYLDVDNTGGVTAEEEKAATQYSNPILNWAKDTYGERAVKVDLGAPKKVASTTAKTPSFTSSLRIGSGTPVKYEAPVAQPANFAGVNYNKFYLVPEWPNQKVSVNGITVLRQTGEVDKNVTGILELSLAGYIEDSDMFVFVSNSNYRGGNKYGKGDQIAIKRSEVPQYSDFEVNKDGKITPVKNIVQTTGTEAVKRKVYKDGKWVYE